MYTQDYPTLVAAAMAGLTFGHAVAAGRRGQKTLTVVLTIAASGLFAFVCATIQIGA